jgi:hypothetical protein
LLCGGQPGQRFEAVMHRVPKLPLVDGLILVPIDIARGGNSRPVNFAVPFLQFFRQTA